MRPKLSALRWYIKNLAGYIARWRITRRSEGPIAYFDIRANVYHRYLLILMLMLRDKGYRIRWRHRYSSLARWDTSLLVKYLPGLEMTLAAPPPSSLTFTDEPGNGGILLDPDIFSDEPPSPATYLLPMPMVDSLYAKKAHTWMPDLSTIHRTRTVFFAGNQRTEQYRSPVLRELFGCASRMEVLDDLSRQFPQRLHFPNDKASLRTPPPGKDLIILDRRRYNIPHEELRPTLAQHDFFLALPGVVMPLCHNLTEAMSVGCIPILQHGHLLSPPLEHGVTCLTFQSGLELTQLIDRIKDLDDPTILAMRRNVLDHYLRHLSVDAVVGKLASGTINHVRMNAEANSVALLAQAKGIRIRT